MKVVELVPMPEMRIFFNLGSFKSIPKKSGCYVLSTFEETIIYIGLSNNLFDRFQQHLGNLIKTQETIMGKAIWFYFTVYDPKNLAKLERSWLNEFNSKHGCLPILNKINSPIN